MTHERLRACLDIMGWSQRGLGRMTGYHEASARLWGVGGGPVPPDIAAWLETLCAFMLAHPCPSPPPPWLPLPEERD
jgi:hypothetical protein